jgi:tetratricopeptide (TPR) repeat protein
MGQYGSTKEKPQEAKIKNYQKVLESAKKGKDKEKEIDALIVLGNAYRLNRELQKANQYSQEALHLAKEQGDIHRANMAMGAIEKLPTWISYKKVRLPTCGKLK